MTQPDSLVSAVLLKVREQTDALIRMTEMVPWDKLAFRPVVEGTSAGARIGTGSSSELLSLSHLLGHLLECLAGFCALLHKLNPQRLGHFQALREKPVNQECSPGEARDRIGDYMCHIEEGFALLTDEDLARIIPTVFVQAGEPAMTILLGNLEHLMNHKYQLFMYLRLLGVDVGTPDLYKLRGA